MSYDGKDFAQDIGIFKPSCNDKEGFNFIEIDINQIL